MFILFLMCLCVFEGVGVGNFIKIKKQITNFKEKKCHLRKHIHVKLLSTGVINLLVLCIWGETKSQIKFWQSRT